MENPDRKSYSLSQLSSSIQSVIRKAYRSEYWIRAEMSKLNHYPHSGHCYPDLVEKDGTQVKAQMRAIIWATDFNKIQRTFTRLTGKPLKDDIEILFKAKVDFSPKYGLSLQILDIDPNFTLGQMLAEKQACIQKLKTQKLFERNRSLEFPILPQRIAIISVESSKGYHDLLQVFEQNPKGYKFHHQLFPALLQGEKAVSSIMRQLDVIENQIENFDMVAIIRGGGGEIGLSAYDHYDLASSICRFPLPVLTGIGHSTNETVSEMVAWKNAITPTDLGFFLVGKMEEQELLINELGASLGKATKELLHEEKQNHKNLARILRVSTHKLLQSFDNLLERIEYKLKSKSQHLINREKEQFEYFNRILRSSVQKQIRNQQQNLNDLKGDLHRYKNILQHQFAHMGFLAEKIHLMNPENLLKKGYSITTVNGKLITQTDKLNKGDTLVTKIYKAEIESTIDKIHNHD